MYSRNIVTFLKHLIEARRAGDRPDRRDHARNAGDARAARWCIRACARRSGCRTPARRKPHSSRRGELNADRSSKSASTSSCWRRSSGFELIRRVSPLLHTPLMSLTNAISAIAVVGAILITGAEAREHAEPRAGLHRRDCVHHQRGQRLPDHRPHAQDVQDAQAGEPREARNERRTLVQFIYIARRRRCSSCR